MSNKEFFLKRWEQEMQSTLSAIKALPTELNRLNFKPDPLSRSAHEIIGHILPHAEALLGAIDTCEIAESQKEFSSVNEAHDYYETCCLQLIEDLNTVSDDQWENETVKLCVNGMKIFEGKMTDMFWMMLFDTIHHRGQLSTYYRQMGVRNPQIYGPTAEDMEAYVATLQGKN